MNNLNIQLKGLFHLKSSLPGVFIDTYSQKESNLGDSYQQEKFNQQTRILWEFASTHSEFPFQG